MLLKTVKARIALLANPSEGFAGMRGRTLEDMVSEYIKILLLAAVAAAVAGALFMIGQAVYLDVFRGADIFYVRMLNYALGRAGGILLFYVVAGTALLMLVALVLRPFSGVKYTDVLKVLMYAVSPLLLFGWVPFMAVSLLVWCIFLFVIGVRSMHHGGEKHGIHRRD